MTPSLLALSFSGSLTEIGAIAAFAALLGIAVLSLLSFSQAREIKRLREWAGRAPERAADLEQRVSADAAARVPRPEAGVQPGVPSGVQSVRPVSRAAPIASHAASASPAAALAAGSVAASAAPSPPGRAAIPPGTPPTPAGAPVGQAAQNVPPIPAVTPPAPGVTAAWTPSGLAASQQPGSGGAVESPGQLASPVPSGVPASGVPASGVPRRAYPAPRPRGRPMELRRGLPMPPRPVWARPLRRSPTRVRHPRPPQTRPP